MCLAIESLLQKVLLAKTKYHLTLKSDLLKGIDIAPIKGYCQELIIPECLKMGHRDTSTNEIGCHKNLLPAYLSELYEKYTSSWGILIFATAYTPDLFRTYSK